MSSVFFFGAMSPYSWFAAERIGTLLPDAEWRPVFAGGLFKACGRVSWGLTEDRAAKLADCEARARAYGLGPIHWPDPWPTNDVLVARAMIVADQRGALTPFALTAMRMAFGEGLDLGQAGVVRAVAERWACATKTRPGSVALIGGFARALSHRLVRQACRPCAEKARRRCARDARIGPGGMTALVGAATGRARHLDRAETCPGNEPCPAEARSPAGWSGRAPRLTPTSACCAGRDANRAPLKFRAGVTARSRTR